MAHRARASDWMRTGSDHGSDEEAMNGYSDEEERQSRGSRPTKRRRLSHDEEDMDDDDDEDEADLSGDEEVRKPIGGKVKKKSAKLYGEDEDEDDEDDFEDDDGDDDDDLEADEDEEDEDEAERSLPAISSKPLLTKSAQAESPGSKAKSKSKSVTDQSASLDIIDPSALKNLTPAQLASAKLTLKKTGVIYLSRIPPYMSPPQIRHLLSRFGTINRIFLSPEAPQAYQKRIKNGGNKKRQFVEGWIEFAKKKHAKWCAESLNAEQVGGKKGGWWYDDVWNMKYLSGFKWSDLTEQIANENAARQARLRAEIAQATRENKTYIRNVERAKMVENMQAAGKEKKRKASSIPANGAAESGEADNRDKIRRTFKQRNTLTKTVKDGEKSGKEKSEAMKKLLSSVF